MLRLAARRRAPPDGSPPSRSKESTSKPRPSPCVSLTCSTRRERSGRPSARSRSRSRLTTASSPARPRLRLAASSRTKSVLTARRVRAAASPNSITGAPSSRHWKSGPATGGASVAGRMQRQQSTVAWKVPLGPHRSVNGQVEVPGFGQVKVPTLCGLFRGSGAVLLDVGGLGACGRTGRW